MKSVVTVPGTYDGREQAWIKHQLLKSYLERLLMIVGMGGRRTGEIELCYVDCFSGPWGDDSEGLEGTSIAISLQTMERCRRVLLGKQVKVTMRALFVERDPVAFGRLQTHLSQSCPSGVRADCMHGDFVDLRQSILAWCGRRAFTFFFVDPKGWKPIDVNVLKPLLERPNSEFLINFMYDFVNRTASMVQWQSDIAHLLGCDVGAIQEMAGMTAEERESFLVKAYRAGLKQCLTVVNEKFPPRTAHVRVLDPQKDRAKYHLVYLTSHPKGIVEFMEISEGLEIIQRRVLAAKRHARRQERTGMDDLFGDEGFAPASNVTDAREVDGFWLCYLVESPTQVGEKEMADFFEATGWMPGDYQASLVRLMQEGHVRNLDALKPRRSRPLHYEKQGERLCLVPMAEVRARG